MGCTGSKQEPATKNAPGLKGLDPPPAGTPTNVKLVLLGDSGVGKSCLVVRYARGTFDPSSRVTVGAAFMSQQVHLPDGRSCRQEIWDTAGQERYSSLAPLYYRGASAACVVFDITSMDTFKKAQHWVQELQRHAGGNIVVVLVGNKSDLAEQRAVTAEEAKEYAQRWSMTYIESSAKTAKNVPQIFEGIAERVLDKRAAAAAELPVSTT